jgi:hypothetical protein
MQKTAVILAFLLPMAGVACTKSEPSPTPPPETLPPTTQPAAVGVGPITLGNAIGADKRVTVPSEAFGVKDTIYASVESSWTGQAKLRALWSFVKGEQTTKVDEATIELDARGPAVNEFHISKRSGWPKGDYRIEVFLNDAPSPAATKTFKVS